MADDLDFDAVEQLLDNADACLQFWVVTIVEFWPCRVLFSCSLGSAFTASS